MGNEQFTDRQLDEAFRQLHASHLERQTRAIETIRTLVMVWFWVTIGGAVLLAALSSAASRSPY